MNKPIDLWKEQPFVAEAIDRALDGHGYEASVTDLYPDGRLEAIDRRGRVYNLNLGLDNLYGKFYIIDIQEKTA